MSQLIKKPPLVTIVGPTASGKTALSINVCKRFNGEVVSGDSMQIYKYMDIGTAKPTICERGGIPHHMIDEVLPNYSFSVAEFKKRAINYISDIHSRSKLPVLVGGTGLYIDHLINNIELCDIGTDQVLRDRLYELAAKNGNNYIYNMLQELDPAVAQTIHPNNLKRVIRAIEIFKLTGKSIIWHNEHSHREPLYDTIIFMPEWERERLYERIDKRVDIMVTAGLINEVKNLILRGYDKKLTSMQAIGYKEVYEYFDNKVSFDEMIESIKKASRNYAKRQLTWFGRNKDIIKLDANDSMETKCNSIIEEWLQSR